MKQVIYISNEDRPRIDKALNILDRFVKVLEKISSLLKEKKI